MAINGFTNVQQKMLEVLKDGMPHTKQELHACLSDELGPLENIRTHLIGIKKHLRSKGLEVLCERTSNGSLYRMVRYLASPYDGRT